MVRHKTRWLLVRLDFEPNVLVGKGGQNDERRKRQREEKDDERRPELTKKDIAQCIRSSIISSFGVASAGMAQDVQVRLYDETTRLAIVRVSRDSCGLVRAAITFLTSIQGRPVVASVISVNGSARTAKRVALLETRRSFRQDQYSTERKELRKLEERLGLIRKIE